MSLQNSVGIDESRDVMILGTCSGWDILMNSCLVGRFSEGLQVTTLVFYDGTTHRVVDEIGCNLNICFTWSTIHDEGCLSNFVALHVGRKSLEGFVIAFSPFERRSFELVERLIIFISQSRSLLNPSSSPDIVGRSIPLSIVALCLPHEDRAPMIDPEEGRLLAAKYNAAFFHSDPQNFRNVVEPFDHLIREARKRKSNSVKPSCCDIS